MRGIHPQGKTEKFIEGGNSWFGGLCCFILAAIVVLFICSDASIQITHAIHHDAPVDLLAYLGVK